MSSDCSLFFSAASSGAHTISSAAVIAALAMLLVVTKAMLNMQPVKLPVTEDKVIQTPRLGPVGGRIVAEVFLGLMFGDPHSMLSLAPD